MSDDVLSLLIADFHARPLPDVVPRSIRIPTVPNKATALIGMRRSGKTYAMYDVMTRLARSGVPREHVLYLNMEDDRLGTPTVGTLDLALELFFRRTPSAREAQCHLFFDEIQVVPEWERFVRRVLGSERAQIYVSGSSAKLLSTEIATALRGYSLTVEVLPFGLRETLRARGTEVTDAGWPLPAPMRSVAAAALDTYLTVGGFPEVQQVHPLDRTQILQGYAETAMLKDVVERHGVTNLTALRHLMNALFTANANEFSVSRLHGALTSQGIRVTKQTLLDYLGHLTDAYVGFLVSLRTRSEKQSLVNPRKAYAIDPGLAAVMYSGGAVNLGAQLEDFVYLELRRQLGTLADRAISYVRTSNGYEVDFAVEPVASGESLRLVQACARLNGPGTREREVRALREAMSETGVTTATVVTLSERETIETDAGTIVALPAWEWAIAPAER